MPEGDLTATSRGRWVNLELCISGYLPVYSINLNKTDIKLAVDSSFTLLVDLNLNPIDDSIPTWSSRNTGIATVNEQGVATAVAPGTTYIDVVTKSRGLKASCKITVLQPVEEESVLNEPEYEYKIYPMAHANLIRVHAPVGRKQWGIYSLNGSLLLNGDVRRAQ